MSALASSAKSMQWRSCIRELESIGTPEAKRLANRCYSYLGFDRFSSTLAPNYEALAADLLAFESKNERTHGN